MILIANDSRLVLHPRHPERSAVLMRTRRRIASGAGKFTTVRGPVQALVITAQIDRHTSQMFYATCGFKGIPSRTAGREVNLASV